MRNLNINILKYEVILLANELINYVLNFSMGPFLKSMLHKLLKTMEGDLTITLYSKKGGKKT